MTIPRVRAQLDGRKALVVGIANENSIAWGCAKWLRALGADAELVGGYNTEYGGMRFGSFLLVEYMEILVVSGIAAAMFLGGWMGTGPSWLDPIWMLAKMMGLVFVFIWIRTTVPRLRYDQLMKFGWKILLPAATINAVVTALFVVAF